MADDDEVLEAQRLADEMANAMAWMTTNTNAVADVDEDDSFLRDLSITEYGESSKKIGEDSFSSPIPPPPVPPPPPPPAAIPPQMEDFDSDDHSGSGNSQSRSRSSRRGSGSSSRNSVNSRSRSERSGTSSRSRSRSSRSGSHSGSSRSRSSSSASSSRSTSSSYSSSSGSSSGSRSSRSSYSSRSQQSHSGSRSSRSRSSRSKSSRSHKSHESGSRSRSTRHSYSNSEDDGHSYHSSRTGSEYEEEVNPGDGSSGNDLNTGLATDGNQTIATSSSFDKSLFSESGWSTGIGSSEEEDEEKFFHGDNNLDGSAADGGGSASYSDSQGSNKSDGSLSGTNHDLDAAKSSPETELSYDGEEDGSMWESDGEKDTSGSIEESSRTSRGHDDHTSQDSDDSNSQTRLSRSKLSAESPIMKRLQESEKRAKKLLQGDDPPETKPSSQTKPSSELFAAQQRANETTDAMAPWNATAPIDDIGNEISDTPFGSISFEDHNSSSESSHINSGHKSSTKEILETSFSENPFSEQSPIKQSPFGSSRSQDSRPSRRSINEPTGESPVSTQSRSRSSRQNYQADIGTTSMSSSFGSFGDNTSQKSSSKSSRSVSTRDTSEERSITKSGGSNSTHGSRSRQQTVSSRKIEETVDKPSSSDSFGSREIPKGRPERSRDSPFSPGSRSSRSSIQRPPRPRQKDSSSRVFGSPQPSVGSMGSRRNAAKDPVESSPFSVDKSTSKSSLRSWHTKQSSKSSRSSFGNSSKGSLSRSSAGSSSRQGSKRSGKEFKSVDMKQFGDNSFGSADSFSREHEASSRSSTSRTSSHPKQTKLDGSSNSLSFSGTSASSSKRSTGSRSSDSTASRRHKDQRSGSIASVSERSQRSESQSTGESTSASIERDRGARSRSDRVKSYAIRSGSNTHVPRRSSSSSGPRRLQNGSQSTSRTDRRSGDSRRSSHGRPRSSQRNDVLRRETTKLLATVSSIMNALDDPDADGSERSLSERKQDRAIAKSAKESDFVKSMPERFYFDKCASTLKDLDPGLDKAMTNVHVSIQNDGFQKLVSAAYERLLETRPRLKYLLSPAEWLQVHLLLLYDRLFDCELRFHNINLDPKFRIDYPDDLPVFEPLASILASIGVVQDDGLGVTYIPVARPLEHGKKFSPHDPEDVTEFMEWQQVDWKTTWSDAQLGREARRKLAQHEQMKIPQMDPALEGRKLDEWEQLAPSLWLGFDADLWFSYKQACFAINKAAKFVPWSKNKKIAGTYAWLLPREENTDGKSFVLLPKRNLTPDTWMMAIVSNLGALPTGHTQQWYHKTNPTNEVLAIVDRFLRASIRIPNNDNAE